MGNFLPVLSNTSRDSVMMQNRLKGSQLKIFIIYLIHNFFEILFFHKTRVLRGTLCCAAVGNISAAFQCLIFAEAKKQHYLMIITSAWSLEVMEYFSHSSWASSVGEDAVQPRESGLAVSAENYVTFQQL